MYPLCSVCAFRIWKISSCFRIPVAPATLRSLAIWVSFWMLMSFSSPMLRPSPGRRGCALAGSWLRVWGSAAGASVGTVWPFDPRAGMDWRLLLLGIVCVVPIDLSAWLLELRKVEMYWKSGADGPRGPPVTGGGLRQFSVGDVREIVKQES